MLGLKDNSDHFIDPISGNFLDVDPETYLRENTAHCLPDYIQAQTERQRFYDSLTGDQRSIYEDVISYVSYLETVGPKLAHYCGFMFGKEFWYRVVPGYRPDTVFTLRYRRMTDSNLFQYE